MTTVAELMVKVSADTSGAESDLRSFSSRVLGGGMGAVFGGALLAGGVLGATRAVGGLVKGVVGLGASAVSAGSEFAYSMDQVSAVLGATDAQAAQLSDTALALGMNPNLKVSTDEAAAAMYTLATAGLSTEQIVGGAAEATILLANATGGDMTQAATVGTHAMAMWGMGADQMGEAINGVVGVTNASTFDLNDYAAAIAQGGGVAAMSGVSFEDFNATIAATSEYFGSGSDAGTSLKTMLVGLTPTTDKQIAAMTELGLITEDGSNQFYDANGNLRDMTDIVGLLNGATADLTEEQRKQYLQTIFGNDAMRTAGALAGMTAEDFRTMYATVNQGSTAMEQATVRTDNLQSSWETFNETIDSAKKKVGTTFEIPLQMAVKALTPVVGMISAAIQPYLDEAAAWLTTNIPVIQANIPFAVEAWNTAPGLISGLVAAFGELTGMTGQLQPVIDDLSAMDEAINSFNKEGNVNAVGAMLLGLAAAVSGGTAAFDEATGTFTARWQAFQVELGKGGTIKVNINWEMILPPAALFTFEDLNKMIFGSAHPLAWVVAPQVMVKPKYDINPAQILTDIQSKIKGALGGAVGAVFNVGYEIGVSVASVDWGATWTTIYTAIVSMWPDWGETWATVYSAGATIDPDWGTTWTDIYAAAAQIQADWGETWSTIYKATANIFANWGDIWSRAYSVVVDLIPHWTGSTNIPDAVPGMGDEGGGLGGGGDLFNPGGNSSGSSYGHDTYGSQSYMGGAVAAGGRGPQVVINAAVADALDVEVLARRVGYYLKRGV